MLPLLLAATLNVLSTAGEPLPEVVYVQEEPAKPKAKEAEAKPAKSKAKEEPAKTAKGKDEEPDKAAEKPKHRKLPSPAVPADEAPAAPPPPPRRVHRTPPHPAPSRAVAGSLAAEPPAAGGLSLDARAVQLEAENARLRQQLYLSGSTVSVSITNPGAALSELMAGNKRFIEGARVRTLLSTQDAELRARLANGQTPFAVIITCSDSRLADNLIFDQELGRLFTIREAGNSPDTQSLASVEYALEHLGAKLVVVMGHTGCGAVKAVADANGKPLPGNLWSLQAAMSGLLESTPLDPNDEPGSHMYRLVEHNAKRQAQAVIDRSELVRERVSKGQVSVVPAVYDLASGKVVFLPPASVGRNP